MKRSRFSEEKIAYALRLAESGVDSIDRCNISHKEVLSGTIKGVGGRTDKKSADAFARPPASQSAAYSRHFGSASRKACKAKTLHGPAGFLSL